MPGNILTGDVAARTRMLDIECRRCDRKGRLCMQRLLRELGPRTPIFAAWENLNADCPNAASRDPFRKCSLNAPQLAGLF